MIAGGCTPDDYDRDGVSPTARSTQTGTPMRPVRIGFDGPRFDACAGSGRITNLNSKGENLLSVRDAPAGNAREIDQLGPGRNVSMCQQVGNWIGIVYAPESDEEINCGTSSPVQNVRNYEGVCNSGWVNENFVELMAG
ncbi:integron [Erythrobacter insulae]|uniref:integron n=1 Tax=Erythrobacter insulae TaxID=2584124 RepID=UPI00115D65C5|nr:integron [Erythrobacter insulae]